MNSESIRNCAAPAGLSKNKLCFTSFASISMRASSTADCKRKRSSKQSLGKKRQDMTHMMRSQMVSQWSLNVQSLSPQINIKIQKKTWFGCGFTFKGCLIWGGWDYLVCLDMGVEKRKSVKCKSFFPIDLVQCAALCCILRAHCRLQHEVPALTWRPRQLARPWCIHPKTVGTQHPPHPCSYATASTKSSNMRSYR